MRCRLVWSILAIFVLVSLNDVSYGGDKILWRKDYNNARKEASENGKPLLLVFSTENCFHCRRLDQSTFRDLKVIQLLNEEFIPLKVDVNREPKLSSVLRIQAYPTMILASNDGKILGFIEGFMEADRLSEHLVRAANTATPDWMARDFQEATRSFNNADYARSIALLKGILEDKKQRPVQTKAKQVLSEIEQQASGRLAHAKGLSDQGQMVAANDVLTDLLRRYAGSSAALEGSKLLAKNSSQPEVQLLLKDRRAMELLEIAKDCFRKEQFLQCLDHCETLRSVYKNTPCSNQAIELENQIRNQPEKMVKVCEEMNDRLAKMYLAQSEAWLKKGNHRKAQLCLEKIIKVCPDSNQAEVALGRLTSLKSKSDSQPVEFTKPQP